LGQNIAEGGLNPSGPTKSAHVGKGNSFFAIY